MNIGEFVRRLGTTHDTVRYYERNGLLPPPARRPSGFRDYDQAMLSQARFLLRLRNLGFTPDELRDLSGLTDTARCGTDARAAVIAARLADVDARLEQLARIRDGLKATVRACSRRSAAPTRTLKRALFSDGIGLAPARPGHGPPPGGTCPI